MSEARQQESRWTSSRQDDKRVRRVSSPAERKQMLDVEVVSQAPEMEADNAVIVATCVRINC